jgi:hypothetical protein
MVLSLQNPIRSRQWRRALFDHLHFRTVMSVAFADGAKAKSKSAGTSTGRKAKMGRAAKSAPASKKSGKAMTKGELTLQKPTAISGRPAWFVDYYKDGSQKERDRKLFSR